MKILFSALCAGTLFLLQASSAAAADNDKSSEGISAVTQASGSNNGMTEVFDGQLSAGTYEVISTNGSITRALCPYTCKMRGIEKSHCKTWRSASEPEKCYVEDTSLPSQAISWGEKNK
jgi:hypothetical protein